MADGTDVEELRATIERTRTDLGDTVAALAGKADVKARASGAVHNAVDRARGRAHAAVDGAKTKAHNLSDTARERTAGVTGRGGRHAAPAHGPEDAALESVHRDTGLDVGTGGTPAAGSGRGPRSVAAQRIQAGLLVTSVGAVLGAVGVWVRGRRR